MTNPKLHDFMVKVDGVGEVSRNDLVWLVGQVEDMWIALKHICVLLESDFTPEAVVRAKELAERARRELEADYRQDAETEEAA